MRRRIRTILDWDLSNIRVTTEQPGREWLVPQKTFRLIRVSVTPDEEDPILCPGVPRGKISVTFEGELLPEDYSLILPVARAWLRNAADSAGRFQPERKGFTVWFRCSKGQFCLSAIKNVLSLLEELGARVDYDDFPPPRITQETLVFSENDWISFGQYLWNKQGL